MTVWVRRRIRPTPTRLGGADTCQVSLSPCRNARISSPTPLVCRPRGPGGLPMGYSALAEGTNSTRTTRCERDTPICFVPVRASCVVAPGVDRRGRVVRRTGESPAGDQAARHLPGTANRDTTQVHTD